MHDIKAIVANPAAFDAGLARRGLPAQSSALVALDEKRRGVMSGLQEAQSRRNALSKEIGMAMGKKDVVLADKLKTEVAALKDQINAGEEAERALTKELTDALSVIPNIPLPEVPDGADEHGNKEVRRWGKKPEYNYTPLQHFDIGEGLKLMDFEIATKLSGARFVVLKGALARMERALMQFMLDLHTREHGYEEVSPPLLMRDAAMFGTAQLPKFAEDQFLGAQVGPFATTVVDAVSPYIRMFESEVQKSYGIDPRSEEGKELFAAASKAHRRFREESVKAAIANPNKHWLIPTAEVPLTNLVRESTLDEPKLPLRYTAGTACFRAEAGAAGRDTRGMIRQHQFQKVEMVSITTPEQSSEEHERMTACAEEVLKRLGLHFRTMLLCTGDMGFASRKTYDIEVWLPGQNAFREISSCSVCGDFQARRMDARCKAADAKQARYVHTLNGSGLAVGRTMVALLENYQNPDGSVTIPQALQPYMGGMSVIMRP
ncbi:MAG: serine--tRNA ligase [Pseudomonadota bacterium]|nr:serine--tRNA ligase [Pseudomonadota bacterium]